MSEKELNQIITKNLNYYMKKTGTTQAELAEYMNVSQSAISHWLLGKKTPRMSKIDKLCEYFKIKRSDLMEDKSNLDNDYYIDAETREIAREIATSPEMRVLFDAARNCPPDDIQAVVDIVHRLERMEDKND